MLPPDTSSTLFPWRVMVPAMQVYGCFPYRMSATSGPPTFSLPLCLWSVFRFLLQLAMTCQQLEKGFLQYFSLEVGVIAFTSTSTLMMAVVCLTPFAMGISSRKLAELLHDMSKIKGVSAPHTYRWYCKPLTQFAMFSGIVCTIFSVFNFISLGYTNILELVIFTPGGIFVGMSFVLPGEVSSMVFGLLGHRLVAATKVTVAKVSSLLAPDGSFKCESDVEAAMLALRDLDAVIREVELQREAGTRCFFPVITMTLLMAILQAISCPYAILKHPFMQGNNLFILGVAYYIMASYCHLGQTFVNQVSAAEGLLRDLTVQSHILGFNLKVNQLMGRLSHNLAFDMCGWYRLDYSSLLGLINTVLTYLVIIFQVGGNTVHSASDSFPPSNYSVPA